MPRNRHLRICLALLAVPALRADVTLRYETKTTFNPALSPQMADGVMKRMNVALPDTFVHQFRNGKIFYSQGKSNLIIDVVRKEITLLDTQAKRYATFPAAQYADELAGAAPPLPPQASALPGSMKARMEPVPGVSAETILGMEAEEHSFVMTIGAPTGQNPAASGSMVRLLMHVWLTRGSEALRVQAIREVAGYSLMSMEALNPLAGIQKAFAQLPGMEDTLALLTKELTSTNSSIMLRLKAEMFMPPLASLPGIDPNAPFWQLTQELTSISTDEIPDSVFQVPGDYRQATVAEVMRGTAGDVMGQAQLLSRVPPVYPPLAKAARVQGTVTFNAVIGKDGSVKDLKLVSGPPLLVQSAQDAVKQWVYKPGLLNGEPVEVKTTIDVNFEIK